MYDDATSTEHITLRSQMDYRLHAWLCDQTALGPTNVASALVHAATVGEARSLLREREQAAADVRAILGDDRKTTAELDETNPPENL